MPGSWVGIIGEAQVGMSAAASTWIPPAVVSGWLGLLHGSSGLLERVFPVNEAELEGFL